MKDYFKLLHFISGHKLLFIFAICLMLLSSLFEGAQLSLAMPMLDRIFNDVPMTIPNELPHFLTNIVNFLNETDRWTLFNLFPFVFIGLILSKQILVYSFQLVMSSVSQRIVRDVRYDLYKKIQHLSLDYFSKKRTGELISRISNDVYLIENAVAYATTDLFRQSFLIIIYMTIAFTLNPKGALLILVLFPVIAVPLANIGKRLRKIVKSYQEKLADISSHLIESISGVSLVKASNTEELEISKFEASNNFLYNLKMKEIRRMILISPITELFGAVCGVTIFILIGKPVLLNEISAGVFMLFFVSILQVISPVKKLGNVNAIIQKALAANARIYDVLDQEVTVKEKRDAKNISILQNKIVIDCKEFHYGNESEMILRDINLEINKGELIAVVGPTGTGKTTLINLLPRFYDPVIGTVKFDGVDVKDVSFNSLREQIAVVTQETILFNDTVRNNITYGQPNHTQEEVDRAVKSAFAYDFIQKMPEKYNTVIGDRGFRLSGGEKQRIAIARAILKNAPILILDEATSALDSESEKYIQEALDGLMDGRTVIAIAHRLSTVTKADKIVVMNKGTIEGLGRHEDLLKTCDLYARLHSIQFQS
jgi:subfamily B ATP-binding cassette protein MsbA